MLSQQQSDNVASWKAVQSYIDDLARHNAGWIPWCTLANRFIAEGTRLGLNRHFRAETSVTTILFSTLDHHGLRGEPRVAVELNPPDQIRLTYGPGNLHPQLEYALPFEPGIATLRRFLNQLWKETAPEPVPEEL